MQGLLDKHFPTCHHPHLLLDKGPIFNKLPTDPLGHDIPPPENIRQLINNLDKPLRFFYGI